MSELKSHLCKPPPRTQKHFVHLRKNLFYFLNMNIDDSNYPQLGFVILYLASTPKQYRSLIRESQDIRNELNS